MHVVILLLAALAFFIFLTLSSRGDPEQRSLFYLYSVISLLLGAAFLYLVISAVIE